MTQRQVLFTYPLCFPVFPTYKTELVLSHLAAIEKESWIVWLINNTSVFVSIGKSEDSKYYLEFHNSHGGSLLLDRAYWESSLG